MEKKSVSASDIRLLLSSFEPEYPVKKGYVARLIMHEKLPIVEIARKVINIVKVAEPDWQIHEHNLQSSIVNFKRIIIAKRKINYTAQWTDFLNLNQQTFNIPFKSQTAACTPVPIQQNTPEIPAATDLTPDATNEILPVPVLSGPPSPKRLRRDCDNCVAKQRTCINMLKENKRLHLKLKEQKMRHRQERKMFSLKTLNEKIRRKTQSANMWRAKCSVLKNQLKDMQKQKEILQKLEKTLSTTEEQLKTYVEENKTLRETNEIYKRKLNKSVKENENLEKSFRQFSEESGIKVQQLRAELKNEKDKCASLEDYANRLEETYQDKIIVTMDDSGKYDYRFRQCVYSCLLMNVSVTNVSRLLSSVSENCSQKKFRNLPCVSTVAQMSYELGVLANIQVGQMLHECDLATLAWDATTYRGAHINQVSMSLSTSLDRYSVTLNIRQISGGATDKIHQHVIEALFDVIDMYCDVFRLSPMAFTEMIQSKLHSTMSDRAKVNHCVTEKLQEDLGRLVDLKCLVHPLDGLAKAAREVLSSEESQTSALGCRVAELIHQISKLRYKDGSGCPGAFTAFLRNKNIKTGIIKRYVGNRLNILFSMAAVIYQHRDQIREFVKHRKDKYLCQEIYARLTDPSILLHLQVLGLYSRFLSGPWMQKFYGDRKRHFDAVKETEICLQGLRDLQTSPDGFNDKQQDAFGDRMNVEPDLRDVSIDMKDKFIVVVQNLAAAFIKTLCQQLKPYREGPLSNPSEELIANTASAPLHNMHAERTLGMCDSAMRRAPNATLGFIDGKVKGVQNKTLHWLQSYDDEFQKILVDYAVHCGSEARRQQSERQKQVLREVFQKADNDTRLKYEKQITLEFNRTECVLSILDMDLFESVDQASLEKLKKFVVDDGALSDTLLRHVWDDGDKDGVYMEMVKSVEHKNMLKSVIELWCWREDAFPSDDSFTMTMKQFLVDFAIGELTFY